MSGSTSEKDANATVQREDNEPLSSPSAPAGDGHAGRPYTSVVYVHGIGSQRRYEETSGLIDQIDRYLFTEHESGNSKGLLQNIRIRVEPLGAPEEDSVVGYIRTVFASSPNHPQREVVRFYELYWAPVMADIKSPWSVLRWLFKQPLRPSYTVLSPWRERQRLRRTSLVSLFEAGRVLPEGVKQRDCGQLLGLYDDFEGLGARRKYPRGSFGQFLDFIREKEKKQPDRLERHLRLARVWRGTYLFEEIRNAIVLSSLALTLILLAAGALLGTWELLQALVAALAGPLGRIHVQVTIDWKLVFGVAVAAASLLGFRRALTDYLGDVEAWATYEETDAKHVARSKVLDEGMQLLTHVLNDARCNRVVIIAHSLGTSIVQDAVLALRKRNLATDASNPMTAAVRLDKIDHFVTMGSPIDKIEYFFESYTSSSHRYKRVVEALRGDIGSEPFSCANVPHIHWINFWDKGDAISGPLQSPTGSAQFLQRVDNVQVASFSFPDTAASHAGYFTNRTVIETLFELIFHGKWSFWPLQEDKDRLSEKFGQLCLGPGLSARWRLVWIVLAAAAPWTVLVGAGSWLCGVHTMSTWILAVGGIIFAALGVGFSVSRYHGQRNPI